MAPSGFRTGQPANPGESEQPVADTKPLKPQSRISFLKSVLRDGYGLKDSDEDKREER